jgi:acyl-CoA thioesterase YciA
LFDGTVCRLGIDPAYIDVKRQLDADTLDVFGGCLRVGRTSITVKVEAFARRGRSGRQVQVTEGVFTYVVVDAGDRRGLFA